LRGPSPVSSISTQFTLTRLIVKAGFEGRGISLFVQATVKGGIPATGGSTVPDAIEVGGAAGAELGGAVGGIGGLLAGLGLLAIPGVGPMLAVGPLAAALTGAIAGGAVGGFAGSLAGLGISEAEAIAAERHMKAGLEVVIVICGGRCEEAREIMRTTGAIEKRRLASISQSKRRRRVKTGERLHPAHERTRGRAPMKVAVAGSGRTRRALATPCSAVDGVGGRHN
jgi:hypothetical protein